MHDDEQFGEFLRREAKDYQVHVPPPAEAIWANIERDVERAIRPHVRTVPVRRSWIVAGTAIAATLVLGIAVGRWSSSPAVTSGHVTGVAVTSAAPEASAQVSAYAEAAAINHLAETEVFLTTVRADLKAKRPDADRAERSRELLARTRLLLGSQDRRAPGVDQLLEDLELLLAEIAATPATKNSMDAQLLNETMRQGNIIPRIRATIPAPTSM